VYPGFPFSSKMVRLNESVGIMSLGFLKEGSENENRGGIRALLLSVIFVVSLNLKPPVIVISLP